MRVRSTRNNVTMTSEPFALDGLSLTPHLQAALLQHRIAAPTAIQVVAIPPVLAQRQVAIRSGTGTGKTLAYALPLLQHAASDPAYRAVIMAPTPELALQILRTIEAFKEPHVTALGLTGGGNVARQQDRLKKHPQILVGTPGRLLQLIVAKKIKTAQIKALVLDEVDEILSEGNDELLREIASRPECQPQWLCASATFGPRALSFMQACMAQDTVQAHVEEAPLIKQIRHIRVPYSQQRKDLALLSLLDKHHIKRAIIFVNRIAHVGHLFRGLSEAGLPVATISGERGKHERERAMRALRNGESCLLVATDGAARGLDISELDWVIHYEMARDVTTYVHRAGRTGRAGRQGTSLAMVAADQQHVMRQCEQQLGIKFEPST